MAARAMKGALELIKPLLSSGKSATIGKIVIGTVYGDLHDIGKNLVASMFEGCGFEVINLGVNITADRFVEAVRTEQADILCLSALLTTTMNYMKTVSRGRRAGRIARPGEDHGRRCAGQSAVRRPDRRRRLFGQCKLGRAEGQGAHRKIGIALWNGT